MRILVLLGLAAATAHAEPRAAKIEKLLEDQQAQFHIAGMTAAVVVDDKVIVLAARGLRDIAHKLPVTTDTVFPIGSCTKAFTSMAAGIAQDEGLLTLDDSPHRWLPYFQMQDREANELVTLRDMLSHRTGLKAYADLATLPNVLTREEYLHAAIAATPVAKLRATYQYSNAMITAAGEIVARAYKTSWDRVIETKIFAPLGMTSSTTAAHGAAAAKDGAIGYVWDPAKATWTLTPVTASLHVMAPAGSVAASAKDMTRWLRMLASGGVLDGKRLVAAATLRDLTSPHITINDTLSYALGWATYEWNGHRVIEHNGGSDGLSAIVSFMPDRNAGFIVLTNSSPTAVTQVGKLGEQLWPLILDESSRRATPPTAPSHSAPAPVAPPAMSTKALPSSDELVERAIRAAGGAKNLGRHVAMQLHGTGAYTNQGVELDVVVLADHGKQVTDERWRVAGKSIGRVRTFFDGAHGAQQTTFGQDATNGAAEDVRARRDASLHPLLETSALFDTVRVDRKVSLDGEDAFVLTLTKAVDKIELYISARTGLVVRRDDGLESTRYSNFRNIDGEIVPFAIDKTGPLGEQTLVVKELQWSVKQPAVFAPVARLVP